MKILRGINRVKKYRKAVVALGVFDGLHRGHSNILKATVRKARQIKGTSVVVTFWPHPQKEESLYSLPHRVRMFEALGIDICIIISFNLKFSKISAEDFIEKILAGKIGASYIYIGKNYRFGRNASGDYGLLKKVSKIYKFKVRGFSIIKAANQDVSSTAIRRLIKQGRLKKSEKLLGRPVSVLGSVIKGSRLGRRLGYPTANINPHHEVVPPEGIYAVKVIFENKIYKGICYIGRKPTMSPKKNKPVIEVHIFDFYKAIYGKYLEIQFFKLIRPDKKFSTIKTLASQIKKDIASCRKILNP
jgi:riboflavin kinase/FMN adenylyltransferase